MDPLNIGQAAAAAGVSAQMIRHYEGIGLIPKARRTYSGYRTYSDKEIHVLRFIRRARSLGFSIKEIAEMNAMKATLEHLAKHCHGERPAGMPDPRRTGCVRFQKNAAI